MNEASHLVHPLAVEVQSIGNAPSRAVSRRDPWVNLAWSAQRVGEAVENGAARAPLGLLVARPRQSSCSLCSRYPSLPQVREISCCSLADNEQGMKESP